MEQNPRKVAALYARVSTLDQDCEVMALIIPVSRVRWALAVALTLEPSQEAKVR